MAIVDNQWEPSGKDLKEYDKLFPALPPGSTKPLPGDTERIRAYWAAHEPPPNPVELALAAAGLLGPGKVERTPDGGIATTYKLPSGGTTMWSGPPWTGPDSSLSGESLEAWIKNPSHPNSPAAQLPAWLEAIKPFYSNPEFSQFYDKWREWEDFYSKGVSQTTDTSSINDQFVAGTVASTASAGSTADNTNASSSADNTRMMPGSGLDPSSDVTNLPGKGKAKIDAWIAANNLNQYGDPQGTVYAGGNPLFDEATGKTISRYKYIRQNHPDKPWRKMTEGGDGPVIINDPPTHPPAPGTSDQDRSYNIDQLPDGLSLAEFQQKIEAAGGIVSIMYLEMHPPRQVIQVTYSGANISDFEKKMSDMGVNYTAMQPTTDGNLSVSSNGQVIGSVGNEANLQTQSNDSSPDSTKKMPFQTASGGGKSEPYKVPYPQFLGKDSGGYEAVYGVPYGQGPTPPPPSSKYREMLERNKVGDGSIQDTDFTPSSQGGDNRIGPPGMPNPSNKKPTFVINEDGTEGIRWDEPKTDTRAHRGNSIGSGTGGVTDPWNPKGKHKDDWSNNLEVLNPGDHGDNT